MKAWKKPSTSSTHHYCLFLSTVSTLLLLILVASAFNAVVVTTDAGNNGNQLDNDCGVVTTAAGESVMLRDEIPISPMDFEKLHLQKMKNAVFSPVTTKKRWCAIQICGFTSFADRINDSYIGSNSDFAECKVFRQETKAPQEYFNEIYNTSSISCGCNKKQQECFYKSCQERSNRITWGENDCAVLYQEALCNACFLKPVYIAKQQNYSTDISHHIQGLVVRKQCTIQQTIPAFKRMWYYLNLSQPFLYTSDMVFSRNILSAFQSDPEHFYCSCDETPIPTTTPSPPPPPITTEPPPAPSVQPVIFYSLLVGFVVVVVVVTVITVTTTFFIRRERISNINLICRTNEEDEVIESIINNEQRVSEASVISASTSANSASCFNNDIQTDDNSVPEESESKDESKANQKDMMKIVMRVVRHQKRLDDHNDPHCFETAGKGDSEADDSGFDTPLLERFHKVCQPNHVLTKEMFEPKSRCKLLGTGRFGVVYKGVMLVGAKEEVAVKKIKQYDENVVKSFLREISIFEYIGTDNEFLVRFIGACCHSDQLEIEIVTEYCENGCLRDYLRNMHPQVFQNTSLPEMTKKADDGGYALANTAAEAEWIKDNIRKLLHRLLHLAEQICCGMNGLRKKGIIHSDLAVRNILLTKEYNAKIADFGLSRRCMKDKEYAASLIEMSEFPFNAFAPELITDGNILDAKQATLQVDIWSFGCTLWEMYTLGDSLYENAKKQGIERVFEVADLLLKHWRHPSPQLAPKYIRDKITECWSEDPMKRPNFEELYDFFKAKRMELGDG